VEKIHSTHSRLDRLERIVGQYFHVWTLHSKCTWRDAGVLSIAGLLDEWKDITRGELLLSCTMIVTEANELAAAFTTVCRYFLPAIVSKRGSTLPPASNSSTLRPKIGFMFGPYQGASTDPAPAATIPPLSIASPIDPT
jgi:hypothetical protein